MNVPDEVLRDRRSTVAAFRQKYAQQLVRHTVMFARSPVGEDEPIRMDHVVGSGTLVQVDVGEAQPRYGVLTCGHVLGAFDQATRGTCNGLMTLLAWNNKPPGGSSPWGIEIGYDSGITVTEGAGNRRSTGPDLGWLHLSNEQAHGLQYGNGSGAVFYNLTQGFCRLDAFLRGPDGKGLPVADEIVGNNMFVATGWNREIQERSGGRRYFVGITEVGAKRVSAMDGWHYADFLIHDDRWESQAYEDGTKLPSTWGGLSGGAIWQIWRPDRTSNELVKILRGVAFYEIQRRDGHAMEVRAHYDLSLLRLLHQAGLAPPDTTSGTDMVDALRDLPAPQPAEFD